MADRNRLTVQIANKEYTLVSEDSREYMLEVSDYVDHQMKKISGMSPCMSTTMVAVLTAINIADDYFKAKKQGGTLESDIEAKDKEMYDLKHELISVQIKLENADKALDRLKEENKELQMKIVKLETEMKNNHKK